MCVETKKELAWSEHLQLQIRDAIDEDCDRTMRSSYHASLAVNVESVLPCIDGMLPLFQESSSDPRMVKHGMEVVCRIVNLLKPSQIPVMAVDQPLYAIGKTIQ